MFYKEIIKSKKRGLLKVILIFVAAMSANLMQSQNIFTVTKTTDPNISVDPYDFNDALCDPDMLGTFQWAIRKANDATGSSIIRFSIPSSGQQTINMNFILPPVIKEVFIDGTSQTGYAVDNPTIQIKGSSSITTALEFNNAGNCRVEGLYITVYANGIKINHSNSCQIINNIINEITQTCIEIYCSSNSIVMGNYVNTDPALYNPAQNSVEGIFFTNDATTGSSNNIIGGTACGEGNTIAWTTSEGIDNSPNGGSNPTLNIHNLFSGNRIFENSGQAILLRTTANQSKTPPSISTTGSTTTGTSGANNRIEIFASTGISTGVKNANVYLTTVNADASGNWTASVPVRPLGFLTATATDASNNTSELSPADSTTTTGFLQSVEAEVCVGNPVVFSANLLPCMTYSWDFGDGTNTTTAGATPSHIYTAAGTYTVVLTYIFPGGTSTSEDIEVTVINCIETGCDDCIGSFAPTPGNYIVSTWVKQANATNLLTYSNAGVKITFLGSTAVFGPFFPDPASKIIDGWQRIESQFTVPSGATQIFVELENTWTGDVFFDDIRIHPFDSNIKSYVYDPVTLRLTAELDQNNFATFYEYDEEGALIRVKKETEKGIVTIKETRNNNAK